MLPKKDDLKFPLIGLKSNINFVNRNKNLKAHRKRNRNFRRKTKFELIETQFLENHKTGKIPDFYETRKKHKQTLKELKLEEEKENE